jgi:hypothetical protein
MMLERVFGAAGYPGRVGAALMLAGWALWRSADAGGRPPKAGE